MEDGRPGPWSRPAEPIRPAGGTAVPATPAAPAERARGRPPRERAFNAPWTVLALSAALVAAFAWQINGPDTIGVVYAYGLVPAEVSGGRWLGLVTHIFLHGGVLHLFLNGTALLAFGAPVARLFGSGLGGSVRFFSFFLATGVLAGLTFWVLHPEGTTPLVGASGAISGLMGAAARLLAAPGRVSSPFGGPALRFIVPWVAINLVIAVIGSVAAGGLLIAWEAHLGGLAAGLLLIGVFAAGRGSAR